MLHLHKPLPSFRQVCRGVNYDKETKEHTCVIERI